MISTSDIIAIVAILLDVIMFVITLLGDKDE